ncbi:HNH endonuclease [Roseovarius ramblicola]|uniref:HNH endonuclease n=1 Tax=Roseovarius ramblicola TaxID=2022336 RepID=A0ABV5HYP9_9RHOB
MSGRLGQSRRGGRMTMATFDIAVQDRGLRGAERLAYMGIGDNDGVATDVAVAQWANETQSDACEIILALCEKGYLIEREINGATALCCPRMRAIIDERDTPRPVAAEDRPAPVPPSVRAWVMERDNWRCHYCGTDQNLTIDHKVPRSQGGTNDRENLITACKTCNCAKGTKSYDDFLAYREGQAS